MESSQKIVVIEYKSGIILWYPLNAETSEIIARDFHFIEDIQIIEAG